MITRRALLMTGGAAFGAASLVSGGLSSAAFASGDTLSVVSASRNLSAAALPARTIALTGDRLRDLARLEHIMRDAPSLALRADLDPADTMIFEIAQSRVPSRYRLVGARNGVLDFHRAPLLGA